VRDGDQDVADLLRGNAALLDAAKKGNLARVQRLVTSENINCRDAQGRNSTPLHLAGQFSHLQTFFFPSRLLECLNRASIKALFNICPGKKLFMP
jgi:tankyrase